MSKQYWFKDAIIIGLIVIALLVISFAKLNHKREMIISSVVTPQSIKVYATKSIESDKPYLPKKVDCPATLPDLERPYKDTPRATV